MGKARQGQDAEGAVRLNLYVHFPFCRRKCGYCALYSRAGEPEGARDAYVRQLSAALDRLIGEDADGIFSGGFSTVYFGGGSPALCDLGPIFSSLRGRLAADAEFTVELHPLDVTERTLGALKAGGVNRISMGLQSLDDAVLERMGRGYAAKEAERAFAFVRREFDNAGVDLIAGLPGDDGFVANLPRLADWGLCHCSVYALQNERGLADVPDDDTVMDRLSATAEFLSSIGLARYEISNYARPGFDCRHNRAVWRGEDYIGLGDGACGRIGRTRTRNFGGRHPETETVSAAFDEKERRIFRLRTDEGLDASGHDDWLAALDGFVREGLLTKNGAVYRLTPRGMEVCDTVLAGL